MAHCECGSQATKLQSKTLIILLVINAALFAIEITVGIIAQSTSLLADSLDMLADAIVYGTSLYAVRKAVHLQQRAARISGYVQILLGASVLLESLRRTIFGSDPQSLLMMSMGLVALTGNATCLYLLAKHRREGVHMRASWIFSTNDVLANLGVIVSGILVYLFDNRFPDLIVGFTIATVVVRGGIQILKESSADCETPGSTA